MYRHRPILTHLNIMFDQGGLGDCIAWLPPVKFIYDNHPQVKMYLWIPDFFYDFAKNSLRGMEDRIIIGKWSEGPKHYKQGYPAKSFRSSTTNNMGQHMTEHAFSVICNTLPTNTNSYNYLQPDLSKTDISQFNLPEKYVVISTGFTAKVRQFLPEYVNTISQYVKSKGYEVVFLGKKNTETGLQNVLIKGDFSTEIDYSAGIDLIDKTDLFQATKVCSNSKAVVGLDNGILHLAGCTDTNIVGGFTTVNPDHRMPYRDGVRGNNYYPVVPPVELKCRFCQSNWQYTFGHKFTDCFYVSEKEPEILCTKLLTSDLYIKELEKIL